MRSVNSWGAALCKQTGTLQLTWGGRQQSDPLHHWLCFKFCVENTVPSKKGQFFPNNKPWVTPGRRKKRAFISGDKEELRTFIKDWFQKFGWSSACNSSLQHGSRVRIQPPEQHKTATWSRLSRQWHLQQSHLRHLVTCKQARSVKWFA